MFCILLQKMHVQLIIIQSFVQFINASDPPSTYYVKLAWILFVV